MKLSRVIMFLLLFGILGMATHFSIDSDTWWHLKAGEWMVENKEIIRADPFSYTRRGTPWQYPGVWVQVFMFLLYDWFGPGGLNIWTAIMVASIFIIVWKMTTGNELLRAVVILLAVLTSSLYWSARPYLVSFLLFTLMFYQLEKYYKAGEGKLWTLPALILVWVNTHGGFLAGFLLVLPYLADGFFGWLSDKRNSREKENQSCSKFKHVLVVFGLMIIASFITPHFWKIWELPFTTFSREAEQLLITEWQSPNFHESFVLPFAAMLLLPVAILGGLQARVKLREILLLVGFGFLGLVSMRNIFFFAIVSPPILTKFLPDVLEGISRDLDIKVRLNFNRPPSKVGGIINTILVVMIGLGALIYMAGFLPATENIDHFREEFPLDAVEYIKNEMPEGKIFNSYNFGGYLIWALDDYPVYVDGRADLYGDEIILPYFEMYSGSETWVEEFENQEINLVLVEPGADIVQNLLWAGWEMVFEDEVAAILVPNQ
jgi:hypothetical protein